MARTRTIALRLAGKLHPLAAAAHGIRSHIKGLGSNISNIAMNQALRAARESMASDGDVDESDAARELQAIPILARIAHKLACVPHAEPSVETKQTKRRMRADALTKDAVMKALGGPDGEDNTTGEDIGYRTAKDHENQVTVRGYGETTPDATGAALPVKVPHAFADTDTHRSSSRRKLTVFKFVVPRGWRTRVQKAGLAVLEGCLCLEATETTVTIARQSRGFQLVLSVEPRAKYGAAAPKMRAKPPVQMQNPTPAGVPAGLTPVHAAHKGTTHLGIYDPSTGKVTLAVPTAAGTVACFRPSGAARAITGYEVNGWKFWKLADGRELGEIRT